LARHPEDTFEGTCPFHGACLEGYVSAGAIAKRYGCGIGELHTIPDNHPVWNFAAYYLAQVIDISIS
jgi:fructokinase